MTDIIKFNDSVLITIPGIGYINGGMILGEIGDIHRFSTPANLLAFVGLDPFVYQSGDFQAKRIRMSKHGLRVLRYTLVNTTHNVVKNNATFKAYYNAKMPKDRTHYNAPLESSIKVTFFPSIQKEIFANLYLTSHSCSPYISDYTPNICESSFAS